ncbi:MAG: radical SAM protein [bacterium]|nr:radical SAM protein [bacterium]
MKLFLRVTNICNNNCIHCTIADIMEYPVPSTEDIYAQLYHYAVAGADSLLLMRGEAALREDLPGIIGYARSAGYGEITIQTNLRSFARAGFLEELIGKGLSGLEFSFYSHEEKTYEKITREKGSYAEALKGLENALRLGISSFCNIPILACNYSSLVDIVQLVRNRGCRHFQLCYTRPLEQFPSSLYVDPERLQPYLHEALALNKPDDISITTEAVPPCLLRKENRSCIDDWFPETVDFIIHDFHRKISSLKEFKRLAFNYRQKGLLCEKCIYYETCPSTWTGYRKLYGSGMFVPVEYFTD